MTSPLLAIALAVGAPDARLPPMATTADQIFAYGTIVVLVALIVWQSRNRKDPPR